MALVPA
jgi:hypothetical protein